LHVGLGAVAFEFDEARQHLPLLDRPLRGYQGRKQQRQQDRDFGTDSHTIEPSGAHLHRIKAASQY
jgi:hypothetical protein